MKKEELIQALRNSECLISSTELKAIYDRLATELNLYYYGLNPIVLIILNGGLIPAGQLLPRLNFFARIGYLHATRYENNEGKNLLWKAKPSQNITGEDVLLIDDIFDEGITLKNVYEELLKEKPNSLKTCTLLNKIHNRKVDNFQIDFVGTDVEDRYLVGSGMDFYGYFRNLNGIYALKE